METECMSTKEIPSSEYRRRCAYDLAWRLIRHGARTNIISRWTGLAGGRIRRLRQSYKREVIGVALKRPRGRSPYRIASLLGSPRQKREAEQLARICRDAAVFPKYKLGDVQSMLPGIKSGERLCAAFEAFKLQFPLSKISIDHAVLLVIALARCEEIGLGFCIRCGGVTIIDYLGTGSQHCVSCASFLRDQQA